MSSLPLRREPWLPVSQEIWADRLPAIPAERASPLGAFALLVAVNATLFVRPAEIVPAVIGWPIYQVLIVTCLLLSLSQVLPQLTLTSLQARPVTVCVLALLPFAVMSLLANGEPGRAVEAGVEFGKVVIYYLLVVGLVNTPGRLRQMLFWLTIFSVVLILLAVLNYHDVIQLPNVTTLQDHRRDEFTGRDVITLRMRSTGIFADPNELCLILVFGLVLCLYWMSDRHSTALRYLWILPFGMMLYAMALTQSRGGFLAFLAAMLSFIYARYGKARGLMLTAAIVPALFILFAGRMTSVSVGEHTAQDRIQLWSDGLVMLQHQPLFGVGYGMFKEHARLVAHNSFVHAFAEIGLFGGAMFLGAFYVCLREMRQLSASDTVILDDELAHLRPYLVAALVGYVGGMMFITFCYSVPTYAVLGLTIAYLHMTPTESRQPMQSFSVILATRFLTLSLVFLASLYVFVRVFK